MKMTARYQPVNYGVAGNTSAPDLRTTQEANRSSKDLKQAHVMTLTVGGNDLRKVVVNHLVIFSIRCPKAAQELYSEPQRNYYKGQKGQSPSSICKWGSTILFI